MGSVTAGLEKIESISYEMGKNGENNKWWMFIQHSRVGFSVQNRIGQIRRNFVEAFFSWNQYSFPIYFYKMVYPRLLFILVINLP